MRKYLAFPQGTSSASYLASQASKERDGRRRYQDNHNPRSFDTIVKIEDVMKKKTWFAAIVAMSLTVGLGARILTGEEAGATSYSSTAPIGGESALEETAERPWMHPAITVVVKVPAKADQLSILSPPAGENRSTSGEAASREAAEGPWVHPAVTVVVKVPAKPNRGGTLGG